jgi:FkbM family methyltransferase
VVYGNPPDYSEMQAWRQLLKTGDLFIDVGANIGSYSIWAAEAGTRVIAIEPAKETAALLAENVALNRYQIDILQVGASSTCGKATFTTGRDCVNKLDDNGTVEIEIVTIDSVIGDQTVAGMKIDVEGFELDVLHGCARALRERRIKTIQLEWNATSQEAMGTDRQPVARLLLENGYHLYRPNLSGALIPVDGHEFGDDIFACLS